MLRPSPRPMLTWDMVDSTATVLVWAMAAMDMVASMATDSQPMAVMEHMVLATDMERGLLMLRPMPCMDMVASTATYSQPMAVMEHMVLATAMARGRLMPSPRLMPGSDMAASMATDSQPMAVTATDCGARTKPNTSTDHLVQYTQ